MILKNACYLAPDGKFTRGDLCFDGDTLLGAGKAGNAESGRVLDVSGLKVIPGLIDIHTHGGIGFDCMTATVEEIVEWSRFLARNGVTAFFPTTVTAPKESTIKALKKIREASGSENLGAAISGIHIEGPFISVSHRGTHEAKYICPPSLPELKEYAAILGPLGLRITLAPEAEGAFSLIRFVKEQGGSVSIGHSDADYETAVRALGCGADSFTHLFNGMRGIHHREPGTAGAGLLTDAYVELICDGIHLHPEIVRMVSRLKSADRVVLITDAMQATGLGDGVYPFAGGSIKVENGIARNEDGNLAGSTILLRNAVRNYMKFTGVPLETAIAAATANPARAAGLSSVAGTIEAGKRADLVVIDDDFNIHYTFCRGRLLYDAGKR